MANRAASRGAVELGTLVASVFYVLFVLAGYAGIIPGMSTRLGAPEEFVWKRLIVGISLTAVVSGLIESFCR